MNGNHRTMDFCQRVSSGGEVSGAATGSVPFGMRNPSVDMFVRSRANSGLEMAPIKCIATME